jgi:hypothetical protein
MRVHTLTDLDRWRQPKCYIPQVRRKQSDDIHQTGFAPDEWQVLAGNMTTVRVDRKPLSIETMQVLGDFYLMRIIRLLQDAAEMDKSGQEAQRTVQRQFTKKVFRTYAEEYDTCERKNGRPSQLNEVFQVWR